MSCEYNVSNVSSVSMRGFLILKLFCSVDMYLKGITECDLIGRSVSLTNCNFCLKRIHFILKIDFSIKSFLPNDNDKINGLTVRT